MVNRVARLSQSQPLGHAIVSTIIGSVESSEGVGKYSENMRNC